MSTHPDRYKKVRDCTLTEVLISMHPKEPFRLAIFGSGKDFAQLCKEMPCSASWLRRVMDDEKFYPRYTRLPRFCEVTGSNLPLLWLSAHGGGETPEDTMDARELLEAMVAMQTKLGAAGACALDAAKDEHLDASELRRQIGVLTPLIHAALTLAKTLRSTLLSERRAAKKEGA